MSGLPASVVAALLLTLAVEGIVVALLRREARGTWLLMSAACNLATNPVLNIVLAAVRAHGVPVVYAAAFLTLEAIAVLVEAGLYRLGTAAPFRRCLTVSALANAVSMMCGIVLTVILRRAA